MILKCSMLFAHFSRVDDPGSPIHRIGGWSEHYYWEGTDVSLFIAQFMGGAHASGSYLGLCAARAGILPKGASVVGQRWQQVDPLGPAQSRGVTFPGSTGLEADVPQMTLLCSAPGVGVRNVRKLMLRGMPDARVTQGEFDAPTGYVANLNAFFTRLSTFSFRGRDLAQPAFKIVSIDANGNVQCDAAVPFPALSYVAIGRTKNSLQRNVNGIFQVESISSTVGLFKVRPWTAGACTGGYARQHVVIYPKFDAPNVKFDRIIVRKVGRPFTQYRGRRSRRRA